MNFIKTIKANRKNAYIAKIVRDVIKANESKDTIFLTKAQAEKKYGKKAGQYFISIKAAFANAEWIAEGDYTTIVITK